MSITRYFVERGLSIVPEVSDDRFSMHDDGAVEIETGEFLYGLIKRLKPESCLSTGVYTGISDLYIAKALQDNLSGHLDAVEYEQFHIDRAKDLWKQMGVADYITAIKSDSLQFTPSKQYQFFFLDTELHLRFHELVKYFPYLDEGGFIFVHDMPRNLCQGNVNPDHPDFKNWPVGELPEAFNMLLREGKIVQIAFGGARGLVGYYKTHKDDYKFTKKS